MNRMYLVVGDKWCTLHDMWPEAKDWAEAKVKACQMPIRVYTQRGSDIAGCTDAYELLGVCGINGRWETHHATASSTKAPVSGGANL